MFQAIRNELVSQSEEGGSKATGGSTEDDGVREGTSGQTSRDDNQEVTQNKDQPRYATPSAYHCYFLSMICVVIVWGDFFHSFLRKDIFILL